MGEPTAAGLASVRPALADDVEEVARTLARAFYGDLFWNWFMPDDATRLQRLTLMFATFTRSVYLRHGSDCYTTDAYEGAALWAPPGHEEMSTADVLRVLPGWVTAIGWRDLLRAKRGTDSLDKVHPHERHYYLPFVGVAPQAQGRASGRPSSDRSSKNAIAMRSPRIWRQPASGAAGATSGSASRSAQKSTSREKVHRSGRCGGPRRASYFPRINGAGCHLVAKTSVDGRPSYDDGAAG